MNPKHSLIFGASIAIMASQIAAQNFRAVDCSSNCSSAYFISNAKQPFQSQHSGGKLFRVNSGGLFVEKLLELQQNSIGVTAFFDIQDVGFSGGLLRSIVTRRFCSPEVATACNGLLQTRFFDSRGTEIGQAPGSAKLSPSGNFALAQTSAGLGAIRYDVLRIEPLVSELRSMNILSGGPGAILDDSSAAICSSEGLILSWSGELPGPPLTQISGCHELQPGFEAGEFLIWAKKPNGRLRLFSVNRQMQKVLVDDFPFSTNLTVKRNATVLGLTQDAQMPFRKLVLATFAGGSLSFSSGPEAAIGSFTSSLDGRIVWYFTTANALHKLDLTTRDDVTYLPDLASSTYTDPIVAARGSLIALKGAGLLGNASCTLTTADSLQYRCPFIPSGNPELAYVQIPWELPQGNGDSLLLTLSDFSPTFFEVVSTQRIALLDFYPGFIGIFHSGFDGSVSTLRPAIPGESLQLYMVGLGPVDGPVNTGLPWPANLALPLSSRAFSCTLATSGTSLELRPIYAGSAPGMLGIYQVSIQLPELLDSSLNSTLRCGIGQFQASVPLPIQPMHN